ncbi:MAG: DNA-processing protein DprA [Anaerolineae bacterium]|nr:DNA-processing protein DprA [Anaerolineae bacterium]
MDDLKYWLGFNLVMGIGPAKLQALFDYYGDLATAWHAPEDQLRHIGLDRRAIASLREARATIDLDAYHTRVAAMAIQVLTWQSERYPRLLREVAAAPPVLYVAGELQEMDSWSVAVVGTRRLTPYGRQITRELVAGLARNNVTIVSGLARGIDGIAHQTALDVGGRTIAVLGSGLASLYPPEHRSLARRIIDEKRGAVITEYALDTPPDAKNFPPRNRIISGLSLGTIVVEAGERSGALITANFAAEQDREVFAVPGNINSHTSRGPNRLIQQGAKLVTSVEDVLEELNLTMVTQQVAVQMALPESAEEAALLAHLSPQPVHVDELTRASGLSSAQVGSTLALMELKGMVQQVGGMKYVLAREPGPAYDVDSTADAGEGAQPV